MMSLGTSVAFSTGKREKQQRDVAGSASLIILGHIGNLFIKDKTFLTNACDINVYGLFGSYSKMQRNMHVLNTPILF